MLLTDGEVWGQGKWEGEISRKSSGLFQTYSDGLQRLRMETPNKQLIQGTLRKVWVAPMTLKELKFNNKKWVRSAWERTKVGKMKGASIQL